jgi:hypothetical protein
MLRSLAQRLEGLKSTAVLANIATGTIACCAWLSIADNPLLQWLAADLAHIEADKDVLFSRLESRQTKLDQ